MFQVKLSRIIKESHIYGAGLTSKKKKRYKTCEGSVWKLDRLCEHIHHLLFFLTIDIATFALIIK
jgi:hypothetical protein